MSKFGTQVTFTTQPGQRDRLLAILLEAGAVMENVKECEVYLVHVSDTEADTIYVTEVWGSQEAHKASLDEEATKASIQEAMPLIAGVEAVRFRPVGGKGLTT
ncbi:antibiotic biosynthesis monooxygenase [Paenibacillus sp. GD4]|uniref:putative quinol monooxygenase n=1 Tax=Paenibacillus sp. GD4 TaxID=3068890 RepID=UPI002796B7AA|nr:antibiotic biosynthesis monooxygenase [Paenibacillus sp. GD4]MDQ1911413.1 antibiotic biosynthesis monooxygenase [Paenibacillus sp. GD4]